MSAMASFGGTLDPDSFQAIADLAYSESGLRLAEEKVPMIQSRLRHRLRALGLNDFGQYSEYVRSADGAEERRQLISALTTNVSHFFRETHHFEQLQDIARAALPRLRKGGRFRIWSAGCSNGQEPLSAAIALLEDMPEIRKYDVRILATDIDSQVIRNARTAFYPDRLADGLPSLLRKKYFTRGKDSEGTSGLTATDTVTSLITYRELNLMDNWPMKGPFDLIFCRNVVIYFDIATQNTLWPRFRRMLHPDGALMLGHSERIASPTDYGFAADGGTAYRAV